ncbi:hypothetical protein [Acinetobacter bereziniae]|uniref:hypothetical protein n=1 Tax=Acinetobacter bereziniae TaxID=106648 RepID=UPI0032B3BF33
MSMRYNTECEEEFAIEFGSNKVVCWLSVDPYDRSCTIQISDIVNIDNNNKVKLNHFILDGNNNNLNGTLDQLINHLTSRLDIQPNSIVAIKSTYGAKLLSSELIARKFGSSVRYQYERPYLIGIGTRDYHEIFTLNGSNTTNYLNDLCTELGNKLSTYVEYEINATVSESYLIPKTVEGMSSVFVKPDIDRKVEIIKIDCRSRHIKL